MNESQYFDLCGACDYVLLSGIDSVERIAIPWLHVIREHPMFLDQYVDLFDSSQRTNKGVSQLSHLLKRGTALVGRGVLKPSNSSALWFGSMNASRDVDILFVSHLLDSSHAGRDDDFYFGSVPTDLANNGLDTAVALIDQSGKAVPSMGRKWDGAACRRVILSPSLGIKAELALHQRLKQESNKLRKQSAEEESELRAVVCKRASEEALSGWSHATLRIFEQIKTLVKLVTPKAIVVTYEGHAWERLAFAAAREGFGNVVCVGYQHAALFRLQHAVRRSLGPRFDPDHILAAGRIGKRKLEKWGAADRNRVTVMGSLRHGDSSRVSPSAENFGSRSADKRNACLVIPEGIESECRLIFEFSIECAIACPDVQFIWRLHPIVDFETLLKRSGSLKIRPPNIRISQESLENDIAKCRWSLYRGTTAVIQAVHAGLRPLYLSCPDEMTIDPLYELRTWREIVRNIQEFVDVIVSDRKEEGDAFQSSMQEAVRYCSEVFEPIDRTKLLEVIGVGKRLCGETA